MALPDAGNPISLQQVNVELDLTATATINMGAAAVRTLFDDASGAISMSDGYGKSNNVSLTASAASSANLKTLFDNATAGSWADGVAKIYTINGGTDMGILTVPASMGGTLLVQIASGATVRGVGGAANTSPGAGGTGNGAAGAAGGAGNAAGAAISVASTGVTINVLGSLQGGGGGGGAGGGAGSGGQGRTSYNSGTFCEMSGCPAGCTAGCGYAVGSCGPGEDNYVNKTCMTYAYHTGGAGGAGGNSGKGQGYVSAAGSGSSGSGGSSASNAGTGGTGGAGGNGGAFGAAGSAGSAGAAGANSYANGGAGGAGGAAGAAGRAVLFVGISAYTIIGTSSGTIAGAYT